MNIPTIKSLSEWESIAIEERPHWYIPEQIATQYAIQDNGDPMVNVEEEAKKRKISIIFAPTNSEYNQGMYLRTGAAEKFLQATQHLNKQSSGKLTLKVFDTFRPLRLQRLLFNQIQDDISKKEGLAGQALWERTTQFIADPDLCPPHSTGGAVDCTIVDLASGEELPMGTPVDTIDSRAHTWHEELADEYRMNRKLLFDLLTQAGFVNLASEWWHFSYGDQYWAIYHNHPYAIYGSREDIES